MQSKLLCSAAAMVAITLTGSPVLAQSSGATLFSNGIYGHGTRPTSNIGGRQIGWNATNGGGETDFYNGLGAGSQGGLDFYDWNGSSYVRTVWWDRSGNVSVPGNLSLGVGKALDLSDSASGKNTYLYQGTDGYETFLSQGGDSRADFKVDNLSVAMLNDAATLIGTNHEAAITGNATVQGGGPNGPQNAQLGGDFYCEKKNWNVNTSTSGSIAPESGECDGLYVTTR